MNALQVGDDGQLPSIGLGFWKIEKDQAASIVTSAIEVGYRHLDSACDYGNEAEVGQGISASLKSGACSREDLWVTSKLWNTFHAAEHVQAACQRSLDDLQLDYLDLYLVHFPIAQAYVDPAKRYPPGWFFDPDAAEPQMELANVALSETWQAMESLVDLGMVKHIGLSNMGTAQIRDLMTTCRIRPSVLQIELHPYLTQEKLLRFCQTENIACTGFSPLGAPSYVPIGMAEADESVMDTPVVQGIAKTHSKTAAQILLRWGVQRGTSVVPKTSQVARLKENLDVFDFELSVQEMKSIDEMNCDRRFNDPGMFCEAAFNTFCPIYE
jgi:D-xylose reductase